MKPINDEDEILEIVESDLLSLDQSEDGTTPVVEAEDKKDKKKLDKPGEEDGDIDNDGDEDDSDEYLKKKRDAIAKAKAKKEEEEEEDVNEEIEFVEEVEPTEPVKSEMIADLIESEEGLSENFKASAALIFESEVNIKVQEITESLEAKYDEQLLEESTKIQGQIDDYLTYAVEEWSKENKVAIESSLRTEMTEGFMNSLKELFVENYVEVPESKVDVVEELETSNDELKEALANKIAQYNDLGKDLEESNRKLIISEASVGLVETDAERLNSLAEDIDYDNATAFESKVNTLKEFYILKKVKTSDVITENNDDFTDVQTETIVEEEDVAKPKVIPKSMERYLSAISKQAQLSK